MQEALARGDELNTVELAQLAQVDLALRLEAPWYRDRAWLHDGRPEDLLRGLYWLGATRYVLSTALAVSVDLVFFILKTRRGWLSHTGLKRAFAL